MPRPAIPEIKVPKANSQLSQENENVSGGVCGGSWPHSYVLVRPYGDVNEHSKQMDAFGDYGAYEIVPNPDFIARIEDAIEEIWKDLDKYDDMGVIKSKDYDKIRTYLNRASSYTSTAVKLDAFWAYEYVPEGLKWRNPPDGRPLSPVRDSEDVHWPLDENAPWQGACGFAGDDAPVMRSRAGDKESANARAQIGGFYEIEFKCPGNSVIDQHIGDRENYSKLTHAAALNARCAQELVYSLAFYALNKAAPKGVTLSPSEVRLIRRPVEMVPTAPGSGAEEPPVVEEEKEKSSGAILALAAAAIVLMASRKR